MSGTVEGKRVAFLTRHGRGHRLLPGEINFRANIYAMKVLGVQRIISVSAVGSLQKNCARRISGADQFFDSTRRRKSTFFGEGIVAHVTFDKPTCAQFLLCWPSLRLTRASPYIPKAPTSAWKGRNFQLWRKPISIAQ